MIASIRGKIILKTEKFIIVETNNIGYKINVFADILFKNTKENEEIFLWIHSHIREDAFDLYGFTDMSELEFFEMLISVSGIGPKSALAILNITTIATIKKAISIGDTSYLTKISGIGKKTAGKIVVELKDKIGEDKENTSLQAEIDALEALKALGYSQNEARDALKETSSDVDINTRIRTALKNLGNK